MASVRFHLDQGRVQVDLGELAGDAEKVLLVNFPGLAQGLVTDTDWQPDKPGPRVDRISVPESPAEQEFHAGSGAVSTVGRFSAEGTAEVFILLNGTEASERVPLSVESGAGEHLLAGDHNSVATVAADGTRWRSGPSAIPGAAAEGGRTRRSDRGAGGRVVGRSVPRARTTQRRRPKKQQLAALSLPRVASCGSSETARW